MNKIKDIKNNNGLTVYSFNVLLYPNQALKFESGFVLIGKEHNNSYFELNHLEESFEKKIGDGFSIASAALIREFKTIPIRL